MCYRETRNLRATLLPVKIWSLFRISFPSANFSQIFTGKSVAQQLKSCEHGRHTNYHKRNVRTKSFILHLTLVLISLLLISVYLSSVCSHTNREKTRIHLAGFFMQDRFSVIEHCFTIKHPHVVPVDCHCWFMSKSSAARMRDSLKLVSSSNSSSLETADRNFFPIPCLT